jgi:hypothetical protein
VLLASVLVLVDWGDEEGVFVLVLVLVFVGVTVKVVGSYRTLNCRAWIT